LKFPDMETSVLSRKGKIQDSSASKGLTVLITDWIEGERIILFLLDEYYINEYIFAIAFEGSGLSGVKS
jgi:hypothetical protein